MSEVNNPKNSSVNSLKRAELKMRSISYLVLLILGNLLTFPSMSVAHSNRSYRRKDLERLPFENFILTSTALSRGRTVDSNECPMNVQLKIPGSYDPLSLCLEMKTLKPNERMTGFHKDFKLKYKSESTVPGTDYMKIQNLDDIYKKTFPVYGWIDTLLGLSHVNGYLRENAFYGTLSYTHFIADESIICSIIPISLLPEYLHDLDEDEKEDIIWRKTAKGVTKPNAIVSCGDLIHVHKDTSKSGSVNNMDKSSRKVRQAPPPPSLGAPPPPSLGAPPPPSVGAPPPPSLGAPPPPALGAQPPPNWAAVSPPSFAAPSGLGPDPNVKQGGTKTPTLEEVRATRLKDKTLQKFLKPDKHGSYSATVCYIIDTDWLHRKFNGTAEEATFLIGGFVELADWILRSTDWDGDGIPDNIGVRLKEVNVNMLTRELRQPDSKWGRNPGGQFLRRHELFNIVRAAGAHLDPDCNLRFGIAEVNMPKYIIHERGGCMACKHTSLNSFINPYVEKFSPEGEQLRLMYHTIKSLVHGFVYSNSTCKPSCPLGQPKSTKEVILGNSASGIGDGDLDWSSCNHGELTADIPLSTFTVNLCTRDAGLSCLTELAGRNNCLVFEPEDNYCGNGIVEGDEECDCGNLADCAKSLCSCSPRTGKDPCRKLSEPASKLCLGLIRCRGFRFVNELGQSKGSNFLNAYTTFVEGTKLRLIGDSSSSPSKFISYIYFLIVSFSLIATHSFSYDI